MGRQRDQREITLSLSVLDGASYRHSTSAVVTPEVALALTVLLRFLRDRRSLDAFWTRAATKKPHPWDEASCREAYYMIAAALREAGWHAPPVASPPV